MDVDPRKNDGFKADLNMSVQFHIPKALEALRDDMTDNYGRFTAQPFERGFGRTIGHALRRTLLSGILGASATAVRIEGVLHEFSTIDGIVEDVSEILLNIKRIPFKFLTEDDVATVTIDVDGIGQVTSKNIDGKGLIEIIDQEIPLCSITEKGTSFSCEIIVKKKRGYITSAENFDDLLPFGFIFMDSSHSPVTKVNYEIEPARVGYSTDFDKLMLEITTNGTITPIEAVESAADILKHHLALFVDVTDVQMMDEVVEDEEETVISGIFSERIDELKLSPRSANALQNAKISLIGELVIKPDAELLELKNLGEKSLSEIKSALQERGLSLGMSLESMRS